MQDNQRQGQPAVGAEDAASLRCQMCGTVGPAGAQHCPTCGAALVPRGGVLPTKAVEQRELIQQGLLVTTGFDFQGYRIVHYLGVVRGITVRSRSVLGNIGAQRMEFDPGLVIMRRIRIAGSGNATYADVHAALHLIATGAVKPVIGAVLPFPQAAEGHAMMERKAVTGRVVLHGW